MVKFSKQFEGQLVPEWKEAFVDYRQLKKEIKKIHLLNDQNTNGKKQKGSFPNAIVSSLRKYTCLEHKQREPRVIQVHRKLTDSASSTDLYETELLEQFADTDAAVEFFACLDLQLNKVNQFYRTKEKEFLERDDESIKDAMDAEQGLENLTEEFDKEAIKFSETPKSGENLRIHIPLTNPTRTFSAITYLLWDDLVNQSSKKCGPEGNKLHINKKKLHHAEKMIRGAFIELYKGLGYLKTYSSSHYLRVVESSYFNSSDKALKLADEVEELFVKNFAEDDKRKAMKYLKPSLREESHAVTFFIGLFTGCFVALLVGYVIMAHITGMYRSKSDTMYMETVYPVLSMFSLLFLHFFLYGCNIFMWRKTRINYSFIFELSPTKELKYRDVFLICTTSMTAVVGILFVHSLARGKRLFIVVLLCPFNIIYKSSRYRLLTVLRNIVLSPLYKVVMLDFFMADQLCSQVPMLRDLEYIACYYITGSYKTQDYNYCMKTTYYRDLAYAVSFLPYYWRAMQCARRWFDEGHKSHLVNLGKYVSAMLAAGAKVAYEKEKSVGWLCLVVIMSTAATVYQLYWDFVKDWGLLQFNSKNPWLRDELMLRQKFIYFFSMGLNLVLRLAWLQTVFHYNFGKVDYRVTMLFLAALEVVRRGQWNFYRLENEHLNNAGKFRAVKTVPLPFHEVDEQD
ncbi:UNVERIFIED_CONTAM: Phosphate transporter [Sesamum angustifolium]|uniref:Phosphate transporter n=1 Tax=Sesamum angustifolium TaxID=2727405 RepID=A0AAW2M9Q5_9LAMI